MEGCSLGRHMVCEEVVVGGAAVAVSSSCSQGSPDCWLKWPRPACELLGRTGLWDTGVSGGTGEGMRGSEKGEHLRQPASSGGPLVEREKVRL